MCCGSGVPQDYCTGESSSQTRHLFVNISSSIIQYILQTLLDIRSSLKTDFESDWHVSLSGSGPFAVDLFVYTRVSVGERSAKKRQMCWDYVQNSEKVLQYPSSKYLTRKCPVAGQQNG